MITLKSINKSFYKSPHRSLVGLHSDKIDILNNINLHIKFGDIIKLSGKNGSGKTTLLRIIAGIISYDDGELKKEDIRQNEIYLVSNNERSFFWRLSVEDNMKYFLTLANMKFNKNLIMEFLEIFDLNDILKKKFMHLSTGQKRLMLILRGILLKPKLLMLDEPFLGLDAENKIKINKILIKNFIGNNNSLIMVSHNENIDIKFSQHITLKKGNIIP